MSNYAYINPTRALLELSLEALGGFAAVPQGIDIQSVPCELDETWAHLEKLLGNFKLKYATVKRDLTTKMSELDNIRKSISTSRMLAENVDSEELKERLLSEIDKFETEQGADALIQQCGELKGKYEAMKKVLENTEAERYAKFTCFICMDRFVDLFLDPCGHVVCEPCWANTRDRTKCPGCRTPVIGSKKMFNM